MLADYKPPRKRIILTTTILMSTAMEVEEIVICAIKAHNEIFLENKDNIHFFHLKY